MNKIKLLTEIVKKNKEEQIIVAIEELSELQKELTKYQRGIGKLDHIAEEIADCEIMLKQMKILFRCSKNVKKWEWLKLQRIEKLLKEKNESEEN